MPKDSLNIYMTASDGITPVLSSIADKTKALDKTSQELQETYKELQKANMGLIEAKTKLKDKLREVNEEVKEAKKNFEKLGDEASNDAYVKAQQEQQKLKDSIMATTAAIKENQKMYKENIETIRKGGLEGQGTSLSDIAKGMFAGQIGQMLSSSLGGAFEFGLTSMLGTPTASLASDMISSAISGAAAGTMLPVPGGPIVGAAIGGGVGLLSGLASGYTKIFEGEDDAFKAYYGGLYEDVKDRSGEMVESGSALASGRQTDLISFKTMFGSEDAAKQYLSELVEMSNRTPFLYDDLTAMSKTLATYGYDETNILPLLQTIGDTGAALGMGTSDMNAVAEALGRMKSSDRVTMEYLDILNNRGIGAVGMLADAKGVSQGDMRDMISKGQVSGTEAVAIISEALDKAYSGAMEEQSRTFAGLSSTLEGLEQELHNAGGEGYNELRASGKSAMVDAYEGELGDSIKEINRVMGENQARKENYQDQYMREVLDMVLNGTKGELWNTFDDQQREDLTGMRQDFKAAAERYEASGRTDEEAAAQMQALYETAQTMGEAYYDNSEFAQMLHETELDEIEMIRENTAGLEAATHAAYDIQQELSRGIVATIKLPSGIAVQGGGAGSSIAQGSSVNYDAINGLTPEEIGALGVGGKRWDPGTVGSFVPHAYGLGRVPYNGYPALLHEGERVLTASQARAQDAGQGAAPISITITGNSFTGMPEEMADQLAEIIARRLEQAAIAAAPP